MESSYDHYMVSRVSEVQISGSCKPRRRLRLWWIALPLTLMLVLGFVFSIRTPPLTKQAARFLGRWTYSGTEGAKNKFIHFHADGSADWGYVNSKQYYLEWEIVGDSMLIRQYSSKRSAQMSRLTALVFGPRGGDVFEIVDVSDDEFTMRRDYRDHETGEMKSGTTIFCRIQDETTELVDSDHSP